MRFESTTSGTDHRCTTNWATKVRYELVVGRLLHKRLVCYVYVRVILKRELPVWFISIDADTRSECSCDWIWSQTRLCAHQRRLSNRQTRDHSRSSWGWNARPSNPPFIGKIVTCQYLLLDIKERFCQTRSVSEVNLNFAQLFDYKQTICTVASVRGSQWICAVMKRQAGRTRTLHWTYGCIFLSSIFWSMFLTSG